MMKYLIGVFLSLAVILGIYYFFGPPSSYLEEKEFRLEPIKIGFVGSLSGDSVSYGASVKNSIDLAVKDLRTQGRLIDIVYEDSKCNGETARAAITKLIDVDKIKIIIGGVCNGETLAMSEIAEKNKVILFSPSASSPDLTGAGTFVFRNIPSDSYGGYVLGEILSNQYKDLAIISESTEHAQSLRRSFLEKVSKANVQVSVDEIFSPDTKDFRLIFSKIKNSKAEAIIINSQTEQSGGLLAKGIRGAKITLPMFAHIIPNGAKFLEIAGKSAEGIVFTDLPNIDHDNIRVQAFLGDYKKTFGKINDPEFYMAASYDAVNILVQAIEKVNYDYIKVRDYLYNMAEYDGLLGKYSFDLNGDVVGVNLILRQIKDGKIEDKNI
ncbi:MAG: ABC transporter substrate-binding protein [Patescibacteria group bacterium]